MGLEESRDCTVQYILHLVIVSHGLVPVAWKTPTVLSNKSGTKMITKRASFFETHRAKRRTFLLFFVF